MIIVQSKPYYIKNKTDENFKKSMPVNIFIGK